MRHSLFETTLAGLVLFVAIGCLIFAFGQPTGPGRAGYVVEAQFNEVGALTPGDEVRAGGEKIGSVTGLRLDPESLFPVVTIALDDDLPLPTDSTLRIRANGLLGGLHIAVSFGSAADTIPPEGRVADRNTIGTRNIIDDVARELFGHLDSAQ